jgi:hypothetical protein
MKKDARQAASNICTPRRNWLGGEYLDDAVNECKHGRLPGDKSEPCGCWPQEPYPAGVVGWRETGQRQRARAGRR